MYSYTEFYLRRLLCARVSMEHSVILYSERHRPFVDRNFPRFNYTLSFEIKWILIKTLCFAQMVVDKFIMSKIILLYLSKKIFSMLPGMLKYSNCTYICMDHMSHEFQQIISFLEKKNIECIFLWVVGVMMQNTK